MPGWLRFLLKEGMCTPETTDSAALKAVKLKWAAEWQQPGKPTISFESILCFHVYVSCPSISKQKGLRFYKMHGWWAHSCLPFLNLPHSHDSDLSYLQSPPGCPRPPAFHNHQSLQLFSLMALIWKCPQLGTIWPLRVSAETTTPQILLSKVARQILSKMMKVENRNTHKDSMISTTGKAVPLQECQHNKVSLAHVKLGAWGLSAVSVSYFQVLWPWAGLFLCRSLIVFNCDCVEVSASQDNRCERKRRGVCLCVTSTEEMIVKLSQAE